MSLGGPGMAAVGMSPAWGLYAVMLGAVGVQVLILMSMYGSYWVGFLHSEKNGVNIVFTPGRTPKRAKT